ncbi:MAG: 6-phosphogluconolactonase [Crocinitomicaceae bacterium]
MKKFNTKEEAIKELRETIINVLNDENDRSGFSTMLLSGGGTPGPLYMELNRSYDAFDKTTIGLVDERFVPTNSEHSNERLLRNLISRSDKIVGMVYDQDNYSENINITRKHYEIFHDKLDVVVLGMGGDGHTASLFPNDPSSDQVMEGNEIDLFNTNAPSVPTRRITCSKRLLLNAKHVYLLIFGEDKLKVLKNSKLNLPIHRILEERKDIEIYYA